MPACSSIRAARRMMWPGASPSSHRPHGRPGHAARLPWHHRRRRRADAGSRGADRASRGRDRAPHERVRLSGGGCAGRADGGCRQAIRTLAARGLEPAAFYLDTALTSSGIFDPQPGWAGAVSARVRAAGGLIVADEVQYGLGRRVRISGVSLAAASSRTSSLWANRWATATPWGSSSPTAP